ncbi:MAG: hypothetical protein NZL87_04290 [Thermomicrobium sp.]|nr:hypothetical protein [Thermomicrobium sp.]
MKLVTDKIAAIGEFVAAVTRVIDARHGNTAVARIDLVYSPADRGFVVASAEERVVIGLADIQVRGGERSADHALEKLLGGEILERPPAHYGPRTKKA